MPSVFKPTPDFEQQKAYLFSKSRLKFRLNLFENVLLASLKNQSDPVFEHFVLTSETLPDWAMERLQELSRKYGFSLLRLSPDDMIDTVMAQQSIDTSVRRTVTMRIDDDDAIDQDIVRETKRIAMSCTEGEIISWTNGYTLSRTRGGGWLIEKCSEPFRSCAMSRVTCGPSLSPTVYSAGQHHLIANDNVVCCRPEEGAILMTNHTDNVSGRKHGISARPLAENDRSGLAERFGITDLGLLSGSQLID